MESIQQRWMRAQEYERDWWQQRIPSLNLSYLRAFAEEISTAHTDVLAITLQTTILEIGSGPAGVMTFLKSHERYAIDPLEDFFSSVESFKTFRDPQVRYFSARAEELPFPDKKFDLIIIDNVLDHCENVFQSVSEISRVLKKNGSVYVRLNTYSRWGKLIRILAERVELDKGHPNTFTPAEVEKLFHRQGMQVRKEVRRPFAIVLQKHFRSSWIKGSLKMLTFSIPQSIVWIFQKSNQEDSVV
jgi:ubiquinone/menaquinone biosynthesis C-methylase UbiE